MTIVNRRLALLLAGAAAALPFPAAAKTREEAYGAKAKQRLDIYVQDGLKDAPVILFVHGGAWTIGEKDHVEAFPGYAERNGFLLISVGYRLSNETDAQGETEDLAAAIAWAKANVARYGGDPGKIFLIGHSSGAHLVSLVGVDPSYLAKYSLKPTDVAGVICLDGAGYNAPQEIVWMDKRGGNVAGMFHKAFGAKAEALSPTLVARSGTPLPPFLILYITERPDSPPQSLALSAAIRRAGGQALARPTSDTTHMGIDSTFGRKGDAEGEASVSFIKTGVLPDASAFPGPKGGEPAYAGRGRGRR